MPMPARTSAPRRLPLSQLLERAVLFAVAWFVVAEADPDSWVFGVSFVALAVVLSFALTPSRTWRISTVGALRYAWYFGYQSVLGGIDVATRALRPSMPVDPELMRYRMRLEPEYARVLFADTVSLLPGTLSSGFDGDWLTLHVIDRGMDIERSLLDVEERVAGFFGLDLGGRAAELLTCEGVPGGDDE